MKGFPLLMLMLLFSTAVLAQHADAAFVLGGSFVSNTDAQLVPALPNESATPLIAKTGHSIFLEGAVGFRAVNAKAISLYVELPAAGILSQKVTLAEVPQLTSNISVLFITPAAKIKFLPGSHVSPWFSVGGGLGRYFTSICCENKGTVQFGGGLDFKTRLPRLGFRAEVRDFVTGDPNPNIFFRISTPVSGFHHHNILAGGGVVVRL